MVNDLTRTGVQGQEASPVSMDPQVSQVASSSDNLEAMTHTSQAEQRERLGQCFCSTRWVSQ